MHLVCGRSLRCAVSFFERYWRLSVRAEYKLRTACDGLWAANPAALWSQRQGCAAFASVRAWHSPTIALCKSGTQCAVHDSQPIDALRMR
jgi:hypothetical protein